MKTDSERNYIDVCLVWPGAGPLAPPFGAMSIASVLEQENFDVKIADFAFEEINEDTVREKIRGEPLVIGVTAYSTPMISRAIQLTRILKKIFPKSFFIWGGVHPTIFPKSTLTEMNLDAVCIGEGEFTMLELVKCLKNGGNLENVKGLCFKSGEDFIFTEARKLVENLDSLPWYAWHLIDVKKYAKPAPYDLKRRKQLCLIESRGCPYCCSFCYTYKMFGPKWRGRSVEKVIEETKFLYHDYDIKYLHFLDDLPFGGNSQKMMDFCSEISKIGKGITWTCDYRVNLVNKELIEKMRDAGCEWIYLGVESGSPRMLALLKRTGITLDKIINAFDVCFDAGVKTHAGFMVGLPTEEKEDIKMSIQLAKRIPATVFSVRNYAAYAGTELYELAIEAGFQEPKHLEEWATVGDYTRMTTNLSRADFSDLKRAQKIERLYIPNSIKHSFKYRDFTLAFQTMLSPLMRMKLFPRLRTLISFKWFNISVLAKLRKKRQFL